MLLHKNYIEMIIQALENLFLTKKHNNWLGSSSFIVDLNRYLRTGRISHWRCSIKRVFLKISENSQESNWGPQLYLKRRLWHRCFPVNFTRFLRTPFL